MSYYIKNLIGQGEHQQLDFKFEISDSKKIARTFSAFANTDGGKLLIGVKDNGVISGVSTEEEDYMIESAAELFCRPVVGYKTKRWCIDGKWVLEVTIPKSSKRPHYAKNDDGKWLAYVRVKDQNFLATSILLNVWKSKKKRKGIYIKYGAKEKQLLKVLSKNDKMTVKEIIDQSGIKKFIVEKILAKMISIGVADFYFNENSAYYSLKPKPEPFD